MVGANGCYERSPGAHLLPGRIAAGFEIVGGQALAAVFKLASGREELAREQRLLVELAKLKGSGVAVGCKDLVEWPDGGHALVLERGVHSLRHEIITNQGSLFFFFFSFFSAIIHFPFSYSCLLRLRVRFPFPHFQPLNFHQLYFSLFLFLFLFLSLFLLGKLKLSAF